MRRAAESPPIAPPRLAPAWAQAAGRSRETDAPGDCAQAAFAAGAALAALDPIARQAAPWSGVWRQRLALAAAAASGSRPDQAAIRDAFYLRRPADDPGPVGRRFVAWRALTRRSAPRWPDSFLQAADALGFNSDDARALTATALEITAGDQPAPFAAAEIAAAAMREFEANGSVGPDQELLAVWLADAALADRLKWPVALPLLAAGKRGRMRSADDWTTDCCVAYARAAADACRLAADLARRADRLLLVAPKLRAKKAGAVVAALLDDDALTGASGAGGMNDRDLRRLFDRLTSLGAVRELSGRDAFRIYGL